MNTNKWINASNKLFTLLLRLYPRIYREQFAVDMQQVFRDECRNRFEKRGGFGIFLYWLKVLPDLGYTALIEHISTPTATWGLMEPVPNAPLPWKGVFLVLLPGLVYLTAQIGQYTGRYWYLSVYSRAGIYLMIPVMIVWMLKKQFPVWGLIPLGLFFRLARTSSTVFLGTLSTLAVEARALQVVVKSLLNSWPVIMIALSALLIVYLLWRYKKAYPQSNQFFWWIGAFFLLTIGYASYTFVYASRLIFGDASMANLKRTFVEQQASLYWIINETIIIVLLVCVGTLFMKRHGFFSIFIFVGYIMPTIIVGFPWNIDQAFNQDLAILLIGFAVIGYRVLLTLVSPVWMARMKSQQARKRAVLIPIIMAVAIHGVMLFYYVFFFPDPVTITFYSAFNAFFTIGIDVFGLMLAVSLYSAGELEPMEESDQKSRSPKIFVYS